MFQSELPETEQKVITILKVLSESSEPLGSISIARELENRGLQLSERAVRYHLRMTDERGFTRPLGRDGRTITTRGLEELRLALAPGRAQFASERLELLAFKTTFDPDRRTGDLVVNVSLFPKKDIAQALVAMRPAFENDVCAGALVVIADEGKKVADIIVPEDRVGIATVCSVTLSGVLLKAGIPMEARFGGVLEVRDHVPRRFTAIVSYAGSSLDPSEAFIRAGMTEVRQLLETGYGSILANFRELPAEARRMVEEITLKLQDVGVRGPLLLGHAGEAVCQMRAGMNKVGMVLLGGLNPVALAQESGIEADNMANSGMVRYEELVPFEEATRAWTSQTVAV